MNYKLFFSCIFLSILLWGCQNNIDNGTAASNTNIQSEIQIQYLSILPKNEYSITNIDQDYLFNVKLNDSYKNQLRYYDYYFDTIVNSSTFQFYYHCIGSENAKSIKSRFLNEINEHFGEMLECSLEEKHVYYSSLCDSLIEENGKLIYTRFQSNSMGGQSLSKSEYFQFSSLNDLFSALNDENTTSKNQSYLKDNRTKEIGWM